MSKKLSTELLDFYEAMLRAQLNTVRQLRKEAGFKADEPFQLKRTSQIEMVYDVLSEKQEPTHINDILAAVERRYRVTLNKDSVVSALLKRVQARDRFIKTGPNTFALLTQMGKEV